MGKHNCIVLADKHQNVLEGLRGLLETVFAGVIMVANQASLIEALNKIKPEMAIVDYSLLRQEDVSVWHELSQSFPDVKIIIISEYDDPDIVTEILSTGVQGVVFRKYAGTDLFEAIHTVQMGKTFVSSHLK